MKRTIVSVLAFMLFFTLFAGAALAGSAPTAMSYFSNSKYNRTYTGEDGLEHTVKVLWVGETWNKIGTVIYFIDYTDSYEKDGDRYTSETAATEFFENARPQYPDSGQYRVYSLKWYPDGHTVVLYDHRPASTPEPAGTPAPTAKPTAAPTAKAGTKPASSPMPTKRATATPADTPEPLSSAAPTATPAAASAAMPEPSLTPAASPVVPSLTATAQKSPEAAAATAAPTQPAGALPAQSDDGAYGNLEARLIALLVLCVLGLAIFLIAKRRRRREAREGE